jgi:thiol-disulfide isomerase/thioredoxin
MAARKTAFALAALFAGVRALDEALPLALSGGHFNVTADSLKAALKAAPLGALLLGFSSPDCAFCRASESQYVAYAALVDAPVKLARVNAEREKGLAARYDATTLPALVLVRERGSVHQLYKGEHNARAIAAYVASRVGPPVRALARGLGAVDEALAVARGEHTVLLIGFFAAGDDSEDDESDLEELALNLRASRPDAAVLAAKAVLSAAELGMLVKERKWITRAPSVAVWLGPDAAPRAATPLDEAPAGGLSLAQWSARASLPRAGWLTEDNFGLYAATELPMLILFVDPAAPDLAAYHAALLASAHALESRAAFVLCDGIRFKFKKILLGLAGARRAEGRARRGARAAGRETVRHASTPCLT